MRALDLSPTLAATGSAAVMEAACSHCGLSVPAGLIERGASHQFCCVGCRSVHALIREHGLDRYYVLRSESDGAPVPAKPTGKAYAELDDPAFLERNCSGSGEGLLATELYLEGVHCAACLWLVEKLPRLVPGLAEARLDLPRSRLFVRWDPGRTPLSAVARTLDSLGYSPHPARGLGAQQIRRREDRIMLARIGLAGAVAANVMGIAFALYGGLLHGMESEFAAFFRWTSLVVMLPSMVWGGGLFFRGAWGALRARTLHMDVPIALGLLVGFAHGTVNTARGGGEVYFDSLSVLIFLLLLGRYLQQRQQRAAADASELLASLAPSSVRLIDDGHVREVPLESLLVGALVEIRAGELIPADGIVVLGTSVLDVSLLSGESRPIEVGPGGRVHAGTVNLSSRLEVRVESTGEATRVGRLMNLVEEHARRRAPIAELADRLSGAFVVTVLLLAGVTAALWWRSDPALAVEHAMALLIVTCPCALALATPLAVSAAIGRAARAGILVKGGDVLERLARPGRMWLDKTGTLTVGRPALLRWIGAESAKALLAAVETHSSHPLARALVAALGSKQPGVEVGDVELFETQGGGVEARVGAHHVVAGSPEFVTVRVGEQTLNWGGRIARLTGEGLTPVLVAVDGAVVAVAGFGDRLRDDAGAALDRVRRRGWRIGILSGDHPTVVSAVGRALGITPAECRGAVTPEEKARLVAVEAGAGTVVMVGDGVNDAAAFAAASVGVGVHGGAEAALSTADVYMSRPGVSGIVELLDGARRTMGVIRRNLIFSLCYNVAGVGLAMSGALNPLIAAVLMPVSSLTVILSSYRSRTFRAAEASPWR